MSGNSGTLNLAIDEPSVWIHLGDSALSSGRYAEAESWYRQALVVRPDDSDVLNNLGTAVWFSGRLDAAEDYYRQALRLQPWSHSYLNNLGNIQRARGEYEAAEASYRRSLEIEPAAIESRINLGVALCDLGRLEESEYLLREAVTIRPDIPDAQHNLGTSLARLGRTNEAIACCEEAIRLRPNYAEAHRNRAMHWLSLGDYERGWPEYEWRWRCHGKGLPVGDRPIWNGESLKGKSILLHAEQGFGDTLQFARYASLVKQRGADVTLACAGPLVRLLERCPGVDRVIAVGSPLPPTDYQLLLMSLPAVFETTLATVPAEVPYLSADAETREWWNGILGASPGLKVGIAWQGNPQYPGDSRRSFPLSLFASLAEVEAIHLIRLQHGQGSEQIEQLEGRFVVEDGFGRAGMSNWDLLDSAALIQNLDLVVTVDSSIGHLAGALGVPVWVALPYASEWRWLHDRADSPWYPTMRLFRQSNSGDWHGVFERISEALSDFGRLRREVRFS